MRGTRELNRTFRGFGKLRLASGTHQAAVYDELNEDLTALANAGRFDWLTELRERRITPLAFHALKAKLGLTSRELPKPATQPFTVESVVAWAKTYEASARHRQDLRQNLRRLAERAQALEDVPAAVRALRETYRAKGQAHAFAHLKAAALSYLHDVVGQRHPAYQEIRDLKPLKLRRKREGHPCTVAEVFATADALGAYYDEVWLTHVLAGVGPKELHEDGVEVDEATGHLRVHGQKTRGRDRLVPLVEVTRGGMVHRPLTGRPDVTRRMFAARLKAVTDGRLEPYDGRRTFEKLLELARVPPIHIEAYMGHGASSMTRHYGRGNEAPYLNTDAALYAAFLEAELACGVTPPRQIPEGEPVRLLPPGDGA